MILKHSVVLSCRLNFKFQSRFESKLKSQNLFSNYFRFSVLLRPVELAMQCRLSFYIAGLSSLTVCNSRFPGHFSILFYSLLLQVFLGLYLLQCWASVYRKKPEITTISLWTSLQLAKLAMSDQRLRNCCFNVNENRILSCKLTFHNRLFTATSRPYDILY